MTRDLPKNFNPQEVESRWYALWEQRGYFRADATSPKPAFVIVMPPPNVTGSLHLGHMLNQTVQDAVVRWRRMQGYNTLWLPGMDHAGIATQNVVERELRKEGKTRHDLGREKFVERVWEWKTEYGGKILHQIRRIGSSCDWSRERFTLDEGVSGAVREVFVELYREGLIYRGKRLINWCPRCLTALSDLEVKYESAESKLYHIRYPLKDRPGRAAAFVEVATTRPETMLGDTAVAVHPEDKRYLQYKGDAAILPLVGRELPFVQDEAGRDDGAIDGGAGADIHNVGSDELPGRTAEHGNLAANHVTRDRGRGRQRDVRALAHHRSCDFAFNREIRR